MIAAQKELAASVGKTKRAITLNVVPDEILQEAKSPGRRPDRPGSAHARANWPAKPPSRPFTDEIGKKLIEKFGEEKVTDFVLKDAFYYIQKEAVRSLILNERQAAGRPRISTQVRPISSEVGLVAARARFGPVLPRRNPGGGARHTGHDARMRRNSIPTPAARREKKFILHYNFPNFSVGETGRISGPGRREIGHGALAERSLEPMVPLQEYPVRHSRHERDHGIQRLDFHGVRLRRQPGADGCGGADATARWPASASASARNSTMQKQISRYKLLTDIIGWEDAFCDMDCKIAGTEKGITGFQLDLKLPRHCRTASWPKRWRRRASPACMILAEMAKTLAAPRKEISKYAPRIVTLKINPEKIGALIGPGGKNIKKLVEESGCEINIEDDGTVNIYSVSEEGMKIARRSVEGLTAETEVGKIYRGRVVTIKEFGAFVECSRAKTACAISANWPISGSNRSKTLSRWAMKSG